jgi:hypothetical protein
MTKATRTMIPIGPLEVEGFMLPDGSYRFSQASAAEAIGKSPVNALRFLGSNTLKALLGDGYTDYTPESVEIETQPGQRGGSRINALPLEIVAAYWVHQCSQGNRQAVALVMAIATETLERRFDAAFQVDRTETERNDRLTQRLQTLERDLAALGDVYAWSDVKLDHIGALEAQIRSLGAEPWQPPAPESIDE